MKLAGTKRLLAMAEDDTDEMSVEVLRSFATVLGEVAAQARREVMRREAAKLGGGKQFKGPDEKPSARKKR